MDKKQFSIVLLELYALYPQYQMHRAAVDAWFAIFGKETPENFRAAIRLAVKDSARMFPTPGAVSEHLLNIKRALVGKRRLLPAEAWKVVIKHAHNLRLMSVAIEREDKFIHEAARLVGFHRIATTPTNELHFVQRDFETVYKQVLDRAEVEHKTVRELNRPEAKQLLAGLQKQIAAEQSEGQP